MSHLMRVNPIETYASGLMGYYLMGNRIIYVSEKELCVVSVGKGKRDAVSIKGISVVNFVVSKRGHIALLFRNRTIEVRRMD